MRINKYLAACGVASRRACDKLVADGKVTINGKCAELGAEVNERKDKVAVDGVPVAMQTEHEYYIMNKPKGYVKNFLKKILMCFSEKRVTLIDLRYVFKKPNVSSIRYCVRCPAFRRCTVGFWPAIQKRVVQIYEM